MVVVSIIIPIYNSASSLKRCIDSVLVQSFENFELLLVDDGSKDDSGLICDNYSKLDSRIIVFHKDNGGVSSARNVGLQYATGEWVTFVDADDWIGPDYLYNLIDNVGNGIDMVFSYATIFDGNTYKKEVYKSLILTKDNFAQCFVDNDLYWHTSPWSKLYKKSIIDSIKLSFNENMHIGEDAVFLFSYMLECAQIKITSHTDYNYNYNVSNSLTKRVNDYHSEYIGYTKIKEIVSKISAIIGENINAQEKARWILGTYSMRVLNAIYHDNKITKNERLNIIKNIDIQSYVSAVKVNTIKDKILIFLLKKKQIQLYDLIRIIKNFINIKKI